MIHLQNVLAPWLSLPGTPSHLGRAGLSYPSIHTSSTSPRWSLLEDWVRALLASAIYTSTSFRLPSHGRIYTVTHAPPAAGPSSSLFLSYHPFATYVTFCSFRSSASYRAGRRSYSNESNTRIYSYIDMTTHAVSAMTWSSATMV